LNQASAAELSVIPGIGPKTALAILEYRKSHGLFLDLKELVHVKGIGEKKLERIAPYLILSPIREEEAIRQALLPPGQ
jgi:competence protein ComEA